MVTDGDDGGAADGDHGSEDEGTRRQCWLLVGCCCCFCNGTTTANPRLPQTLNQESPSRKPELLLSEVAIAGEGLPAGGFCM